MMHKLHAGSATAAGALITAFAGIGAAQATQFEPPNTGNNCVDPEPDQLGCEIPACEQIICGELGLDDPCCSQDWSDLTCIFLSNSIEECGGVGASCPADPESNCFQVHAGPGCDDPGIENRMQLMGPLPECFAQDADWDEFCVEKAEDAAAAIASFAPEILEFVCLDEDPLRKAITSGPDENNDGVIDKAVQAPSPEPVLYDFTITFESSTTTSATIHDTIPAEWQVFQVDANTDTEVLFDPDFDEDDLEPGQAVVMPANKKGGTKPKGGPKNAKGNSATKIWWAPEADDTTATLKVWLESRERPQKRGKNPKHDEFEPDKFAPTSCGTLILNDGAIAVLDDGTIIGPTDPLCVAAVEDGTDDDDSIFPTGTGDEDFDGAEDFEEACELFTDPCNPDTDGDGVEDGTDVCPLIPQEFETDSDDDGTPDTSETEEGLCDPEITDVAEINP